MQNVRRTILLGALALGAMSAVPSITLAQAVGPMSSAEIRAQSGLSGTSGWMVIDLDTGEVLDQRAGAEPFVPASVAKLPTAAFALDALGADFRFETRLLATGKPANGRLSGDLVLSGGGDPELSNEALAPLANALKRRGINSISGGFFVDGTALPQLRQIEPSQHDYASYNPAISGLNLNFNRVHLLWDARNGKKNLVVQAESERLTRQVDGVRVAVASQPGQPLFSLTGQGGNEVWQMSREAFRGRAARWLPVKRPEAVAGEVFRTLAGESGVNLGPPQLADTRREGTVLASHLSRPLSEIVRDMLKYSTNLTAEVTGVAATRSIGLKVGTLKESAAVMNAWAASVGGFRPMDPGFKFANHSGLSLEGRVSPERMCQFLAALGRRAPQAGLGHGRLPGGIAWYLKPYNVRDEGTAIDYDRLEVTAKTGTMNFVRGLAGYIATPGGKRLAFAVFSNDLERRGASSQRINKGWMNRARRLERALIRNWVLMADRRI
ncbi:MAG: D-alanyl-D-alanine carboxypeptidase/D-alanyl-D-alanine-endopeptidase [Pseudomonadota bacterium]